VPGRSDFLTKPVTPDDLFRGIEEALAHHRTSRDLKDNWTAYVPQLADQTYGLARSIDLDQHA
jgi:FixJ family two-component response regulator